MSVDPRGPFPVRLYRRILRLYPPALRRAHGEEMAEVVRRRWEAVRGSPVRRRLLFHLRTWTDAVVQGVAAWTDAGVGALRGRRHPGDAGDPRAPWRPEAREMPGVAERVRAWARELRLTLRSLRRSPGFTAVAVATLALGIGANTAIFSVVETVLLAPLPYPDAHRLAVTAPRTWSVSEVALELRRTSASIEGMAAFYPREYTVTGGAGPAQVSGAEATPDFFGVVGIEIARGRSFHPADAGPDAPSVVVLSHHLARRRFGAPAAALGRTLRVNDVPREVVGVAEPGPHPLVPGAEDLRFWIPFEVRPTGADGSFQWLMPVLRLAEGAPLEAARAELDAVMAGFVERHPEVGPGHARSNAALVPMKTALTGDVRPALLLLQLAVAAVLLLACVNVANLLLVRAGARQGELAVRSALGASRSRLAGHLLTESVVLSLLGGAAALLLLGPVLDLLLAAAPRDIPRIDAVAVDGPVLAFTVGVSLLVGVLFGAAPALGAARAPVSETLKGAGRTTSGSRRKHRLSQALVVAQVTLTVVLLAGAGLLVRSFATLAGQEPGFRTEGVVAVPIHVSEDRFESVSGLEAFYRGIRAEVSRIPGVEGVGISNHLPIRQGGASREYVVPGREETGVAQYGIASPGYFAVLETPLLRGRAFRETDRRGRRPVAMVNRTFARQVWPGDGPVGKRFRMVDEASWRTVVGVVGDVRGDGLARVPRPGFYIPYVQRPENDVELAVGREAALVVRSERDPGDLGGAIRRAIQEVDPAQPVPEVTTLDEVVSREIGPERFRAVLLAAFAGMALLLVIAGVYGVVAHLVVERTREFGIRVAMGASGREIVGRVLRWGLRLAATGVALGVAAVLAGGPYLSSLLFGVTPTDPATLAGTIVAVVVVTLVACLVPARRAVSVDPVEALRPEG